MTFVGGGCKQLEQSAYIFYLGLGGAGGARGAEVVTGRQGVPESSEHWANPNPYTMAHSWRRAVPVVGTWACILSTAFSQV